MSSSPSEFSHPARGASAAYERYLRGMDASMRQKVALTAAHLLSEGRAADMGMGSGSGSQALAALYPRLNVVGVDVDPGMVERATQAHVLPNLRFVVGDIAKPVFDAGSLDSIFDSSVLHHVTSYGGYRYENASRALEVQVEQLRTGGVLIVRDFVDPGADIVLMEIPANDGVDSSGDPARASTAAMFERFAREFRVLAVEKGFPFERVEGAEPGWRRYRLTRKLAAEFILRKDYRSDWAAEVQEEYTYFTQAQFEAHFQRLGLRVLASTPIWNPWILRHRYVGKARLWTDGGREPLDFPPTNYVIVGEKVPPGEGVRFRQAEAAPPVGFLSLEYHRHRVTREVRDLVRRPNTTVDVVPFFREHGELFVIARMSYPRPILKAAERAEAALDDAAATEYVTEPLNVLLTDKPIGQTVEETLEAHASIAPAQLRRFMNGTGYYPSPGGTQEEVRSIFVEVDPVFVQEKIPNVSGFSTSGRVRAIEAQQLLRAAQVGGVPDARLELNVYDLLLRSGAGVGPWIGDEFPLPSGEGEPAKQTDLKSLLAQEPRRQFERVSGAESRRFLELKCHVFEELDAKGDVLHRRPLEYVVPRPLGAATIATALLRRSSASEILLGVVDDDLPAAQSFTGSSNLLTTPAWRLPRDVRTQRAARAWIRERLMRDFGVDAAEPVTLGGSWHPSPGATPEVVFPWAFHVRALHPSDAPLHWVPLRELVDARDRLQDGHLRIVALRCAHALGLLPA